MLISIQLSDMDLTTCSKSSCSSQKTKIPNKFLSSNHVKASIQKEKCADRLSVLCVLSAHRGL